MKRYIWLIIIAYCSWSACNTLHIHKDDVTQQALPIYVGWVGDKSDKQERMCERFSACLAHSGQFTPSCEWLPRMPRVKGKLRELFDSGYMLAVFVGCNDNTLEWRLYDVADGNRIRGRSFPADRNERLWVYSAAQDLWKTLTRQPAPFLSHVTYVKKVPEGNRYQYQLCIADFDGTNERIIRSYKKPVVSPQWGKINDEPVIFYSEFTQRNVRIGYTDLAGNARIMFDLDGTCVGFVQRDNEIVYCRSGIIWRCYYDAHRGKRLHTPIVREAGPCASPTVDESGNIFYCHGGMIKHFDRKHQRSKNILYQGYFVAPSYHIDTRSLVYAQRINGVMQLCLYDCDTKQTRQVTSDRGDKYDPRWSACGRYVTYVNSLDACVYTYNVYTHTRSRVTQPHVQCSCPTWSPSEVYVV